MRCEPQATLRGSFFWCMTFGFFYVVLAWLCLNGNSLQMLSPLQNSHTGNILDKECMPPQFGFIQKKM